MASEAPAIVLGGGITALSVARSLHAAGIEVYLLDREGSPARRSRAITSFIDVGAQQPQELMREWLLGRSARGVVLPGSDEGVELIARHRRELVDQGHVPIEGSDQVLLAMLDKLKTYEIARGIGINVPGHIRLADRDAVKGAVKELRFPCVLKPVHSHLFARRTGSGAKVLVVHSASELEREWLQLHDRSVEMFVTEVVKGTSDEFVSYYGYLDESGESLLNFTKRKLRQHPPGFGTGTYHETTADPEVAEAGLRFLRGAALRGLGNVEFKRDGRTGMLTLIECNPRFTLSNELIRASGVDLALYAYTRALGLPPPPVNSYRVGLRLWDPINDTRAMLAYRRRGELSLTEWVRSLMHPLRLQTFRIADPQPAITRILTMARRVRSASDRGASVPPSTGPRAMR